MMAVRSGGLNPGLFTVIVQFCTKLLQLNAVLLKGFSWQEYRNERRDYAKQQTQFSYRYHLNHATGYPDLLSNLSQGKKKFQDCLTISRPSQ